MDYLTVQQAAEMWKVTPRRVQDLCKRGLIPGARLWHRSWMLPLDAIYPGKQTDDHMPMPRKSPFLSMTDLYDRPGCGSESVAALETHPEAQALLEANLAYHRGDIDGVYEKAQYFLNSRSGFYAVIAGGMLLGLCAMWKGDLELYQKAKMHICEAPCHSDGDRTILDLSLASVDLNIRDLRNFPEWFKRGSFSRLPADAHPAAKVYYVKLLLIYAQELAMNKSDPNGATGLSLMKFLPHMVEPMISQAIVDKTVIPQLHLRLLCAVIYQNNGNLQRAKEHIDAAIGLALPDGLLGILAEYRRQLGYLLDDRLALAAPEALKKLKQLHKQLNAGWTQLHNRVLEKTVSLTLSPREREVARLAAYGFSDNEIAQRLQLSKATVKSILSMAKNKTGTMKRWELAAYI